jgi:REP-associated tyrosine transposase
MPRRPRCNTGGYVYHALNRAVGRATLFHKEGDYAAFEKVLRQAKDWQPIRLLAYGGSGAVYGSLVPSTISEVIRA